MIEGNLSPMDDLILGITFSHNSAAALVDYDNKVIFASSQERIYSPLIPFNYIKNCKFFPVGVIEGALANGIKPSQIIAVAWSTYESPNIYSFCLRTLTPDLIKIISEIDSAKSILDIYFNKKNQNIINSYTYAQHKSMIETLIGTILDVLFQIRPVKIIRIDHHLCHAYATYVTSGFSDDAIVVSLDGFGDGFAGKVFEANGDKLSPLEQHTVKTTGSPCLMYQYATGYIRLQNNERMTMLRDEYKLLGLEIFSEQYKMLGVFDRFISNEVDQEQNTIKWSLEEILKNKYNNQIEISSLTEDEILEYAQEYLDKELLKAKEEGFNEFDIARSVQKKFEEVVLKWLNNILEPYHSVQLALGGGGFYNVKLNALIKKINKIKKIWVFPASGDEGNCIGACYACIREEFQIRKSSRKINNLYLGKTYTHSEIDDAIHYIENRFKIDLNYKRFSNNEERQNLMLQLLIEKRIVNFANTDLGVEFGPRALMVRSTICRATDISVLEKINALFDRFKFMPLAPVIRVENADKVINHFDQNKDKEISKYMIIAHPCSSNFAQNYPTVVHPYHPDDIDIFHAEYSTRCQLISKQDNKFAWELLYEYEKKTGEIALVNTSFNSHHSPILGDPIHIIVDWLSLISESYLFLGDYFFDFSSNAEAISKISPLWKRAKKLNYGMYLSSKKR